MPDIKYVKQQLATGQQVVDYIKIVAKTSDYTIPPEDCGTYFTTEAASDAVNFTLPTTLQTGWHAWFFVAENQSMTVTAPTGLLIAFNDVAADSIAFSTTSEKAGGAIHVICDGSKYMALVHLGKETQTPTIG